MGTIIAKIYGLLVDMFSIAPRGRMTHAVATTSLDPGTCHLRGMAGK
jgi:hypothetical protein